MLWFFLHRRMVSNGAIRTHCRTLGWQLKELCSGLDGSLRTDCDRMCPLSTGTNFGSLALTVDSRLRKV